MARKRKKKVSKGKSIKILSFVLGIIFIFILTLYIVSSLLIGKSVRQQCNFAKEKYKGACTMALTSLLNDEKNSFKERNYAIWALGQIGDRKTLSSLMKYYTGQIPSKEPLDKAISQYELKKAINLTNGGINITAIIWKHKGIID